MLVRPATAADDDAVGELLVEAFVAQYARKMPEVVVTVARKATLRDVASKREQALVWVAVEDDKVVGTVALWLPNTPGSEAFVPNAADIRHLAVDASMRGRGVSQALLDVAEAEAAKRGCAAICLHVRRGATGVANLYEKRGFERVPMGDIDRLPEVFLVAYVKKLKS